MRTEDHTLSFSTSRLRAEVKGLNSNLDADTVERLPTRQVEKVWGSTRVPPEFGCEPEKSIGEIWFEPHSALSHLLVKFLFTRQKLSVQVHPSDENALQGEAGKEECWLVLDAEPDAKLAIGFKQEISSSDMMVAAREGTIEDLLEWHHAIPGRFYYLPAGTVHAIGAGISLLEIQQASDTTFRLYDYGRGRDLHLERAGQVAERGPYDKATHIAQPAGDAVLVDGPQFRVERVVGLPSDETRKRFEHGLLAVPLGGTLGHRRGSSEGDAIGFGSCIYARSIESIDFTRAAITILVS